MKSLSSLAVVVALHGAVVHGLPLPLVELTPGEAGFDIIPGRLANGNMRLTATYNYSSGSFRDYKVSLSVVQVHYTDKGWDFSTKTLRELSGEPQGKSIVCEFEVTPEELEATLNMSFTIVKSNKTGATATAPTWFVPVARALALRFESTPGAHSLSGVNCDGGCARLQPLLAVKSSDEASLPPGVQPLAREAEAESGRGNFARAEELYLQVLEQAPNDLDTLTNLGVVLLRAGKGTLAQGPLNRAIALAPGGGFAHCALGVADYEEGDYFAAISELTKALAVRPKSFMAHYYLGITLRRMGYRDAAEKELKTAKELEPEDRNPRF